MTAADVPLTDAEQDALARKVTRLVEAVQFDLYSQFGWLTADDVRAGAGDGFIWGGGNTPPWRKQSDKRGEQPTVFVSEEQLRFARDRSRDLCARNEFAISALENRKSYLVGKGLVHSAVPRPGTNCPDELVEQCNRVLKSFAAVNALGDLEQEAVGRCDRDGEAFFRLFPHQDGLLRVRRVEPEHVKAPPGENWPPETSFGVETLPDDVETVVGYWVVEQPLRSWVPTFVPADEVVHLKANVDGNVKRGVPTFYAVDNTLRGAEDLLTSMLSMAKFRAKVGALRTLDGAARSAAQSLLDGLTEATATDQNTNSTISIERLRYASIITKSKSVNWEFPHAQIAASDYVAVLDAVLRSAAARMVMPEWMFTANAGNQNRASALVAGDPSARNFERLQSSLKDALGERRQPERRSLAWRQLAYGVRRGYLPPETFELIDVQSEAPTLVIRDKKDEAETNVKYMDAGVVSRRTVQQQQGYDPDQEDANILADPVAQARQAAAQAQADAQRDGKGDTGDGGKE